MPPQAFSSTTAISVVGVVASPMLTTSNPIDMRAPHTSWLTIGPEIRASRPTTIVLVLLVVFFRIKAAYAVVNLTTSTALSPSPWRPPIVPRIPEIDFMSDILEYYLNFGLYSLIKQKHTSILC